MDFAALVAALKARWPEVEAPAVAAGDPCVILPAARSLEILGHLRSDPALAFDSLACLSGVDTGKEFWVVYHLHSFSQRHRLTVKVSLPREGAEVENVAALWAGAEFFEREAYDLFGIVFRHHPDLRRLLNPPDWAGWPLRKDYVYPKEYEGVALARAGQLFAEDLGAKAAGCAQPEGAP